MTSYRGFEGSTDAAIRVQAYGSRWYVLIMVAMTNCLTNALWSTWGPIAQSAKLVYKWNSGRLSFVINAGNVGSLLAIFPGSYLIDRKGIRVATLIACLMLALGTGVRVITMEPAAATYLIAAGQFLGGLANGVTGAIPPAVSEVWFPANERATATAIASLSAAFGAGVSNLLGPNIVSEAKSNGSVILLNDTDVGTIRHQIRTLNYIVFGWAGLLLLVAVLYLPAKPPTPPSVTASTERQDFKAGLKTVMTSGSLWYIALMFAVPMGSYGTMTSILDTILHPMGITQTEAGQIGFYSSLGGVLAGIIVGRLADHFKRRLKAILLCTYISMTILFAVFACVLFGALPSSKVLLYVTCISGGVLISASSPLLLELACETTYPVGEGLTAGILSLVINLIATLYLFINMIPGIGTVWIPWVLVGVLALAIPLLFAFKVTYRREDIDTGEITPNATETTSVREDSSAGVQSERLGKYD